MRRINGIPLDQLLTGPLLSATDASTRNAVPPIQIKRWIRNGTVPNAALESLKGESLNQGAMCSQKTYFEFVGHLRSGGLGGGVSTNTVMYRSAFRTGPFAHAAIVNMIMSPMAPTTPPEHGYAQLDIYTGFDETGLVSSTQFSFGVNALTVLGANWRDLREIEKMVDLSPNTDYYAKISVFGPVRLLSAGAFELASLTEHNAGYLPQNLAAHEPIVDALREQQVSLLTQAWDGGASPLFTWSTSPGGGGLRIGIGNSAPDFSWYVTSSGVGTNILDAGNGDTKSTTVSANTPGFIPDLEYKKRRSQPGVPCVMKAFGYADPTLGGTVELKDSTGAVIASIDNWTSTPSWRSTTFELPAVSNAKYDIHFRTEDDPFSLWAVVLYPLG
jgi:hypothetical protein